MKILFLLKEGIINLKRARLPAVVSILSISLSLSLIGIFTLLGQNVKDIFFRSYKQIEIEVFLDPSFSEQQITNLKNDIQKYSQPWSEKHQSNVLVLHMVMNQKSASLLCFSYWSTNSRRVN